MILQETINSPIDNGIFKLLKDKFSWLTSENVIALNMSYYFGHSGSKEITPLYENLLENYSQEDALAYMANIVYVTYGKSWDKIYQALEEEYNPIHNYNMSESEENTNTSIGSVSGRSTSSNTGSSSETGETSNTNTGNISVSSNGTSSNNVGENEDINTSNKDNINTKDSTITNNSIYGFNSVSSKPSDNQNKEVNNTQESNGTEDLSRTFTKKDSIESTSSSSQENSDRSSGTRTSTRNDTHSSEATNAQDSNNTNSGTRKLTRSGNIGVTTSQKMLREELEVRKTIFFDNIMKDVDKLLCLCIY